MDTRKMQNVRRTGAIALAAIAALAARGYAGQISSMENDVDPVHTTAGQGEPAAYTWGDSFDSNQVDHNYSLIGVTDGTRSMSLHKPGGGFSWGTQFLLNDPANQPRFTDLVGAGTTDVNGNFFPTQPSSTKLLMDITTPPVQRDYQVGFGAANYGFSASFPGYFIDSYNPSGGGNYYQHASNPASQTGYRTQTYTWDLGGEFRGNGLPMWDHIGGYVILHFNINSGPAGADADYYYDNLRVVNEDITTRSTWQGGTAASWTDAASWAHGVPNAVGAPAIFYSTGQNTVTLNSAVTVGSIIFDSGETAFTSNGTPAPDSPDKNWAITGSGNLTFDVASGNAEMYVIEGTNSIAVPVTVNDNMVIDTSSGFGGDSGAPNGGRGSNVPITSMSFAGPMTLASGVTLTTRGGGTLSFGSISGSAAGVTINGGSSTFTGNVNVATLTIASSGNLAVTAGGNKLIRAGALAINTATLAIGSNTFASSGNMDLADNDMIVGSGSKAEIGARITAARHGGVWDGRGLTSSVAAVNPSHNTTFGLLSGAEYSGANAGTTTFDGATITPTNLIVKYTYYGDTDLNGRVNFDDYVRTDNGFNNHLTGWLNGDFDYNGQVNFDDYVLIDLAFNTQSGTLGRALSYLDGSNPSGSGMNDAALRKVQEHFSEFGGDYASHFLAAVPEPTTVALGSVVTSVTLLARRRRRDVETMRI